MQLELTLIKINHHIFFFQRILKILKLWLMSARLIAIKIARHSLLRRGDARAWPLPRTFSGAVLIAFPVLVAQSKLYTRTKEQQSEEDEETLYKMQ